MFNPPFENTNPAATHLSQNPISTLKHFQFAEAALAKGDYANALRWFTLASLPKASANNTSEQELIAAAEGRVEEVKNKIAELELQKNYPAPCL